MVDKIILYNHFHNGDIILSREFIKFIVSNVKLPIEYAHENSNRLLLDIPINILNINSFNIPREPLSFIKDNILYINTWIGANNRSYLNSILNPNKGIDIDLSYALFADIIKVINNELKINLCLPAKVDLLPNPDYTKYHINLINQFMSKNKQTKVFIANGNCKSGQAYNTPFENVVVSLAKKYRNIIFFLTNKNKKIMMHNVFYTSDIIQCPFGSDLIENGYLSQFCKIIAGRSSGAHCAAMNKINFTDSNKKHIYFCNGNEIFYKETPCKTIWEPNHKAENNIFSALNKAILEL